MDNKRGFLFSLVAQRLGTSGECAVHTDRLTYGEINGQTDLLIILVPGRDINECLSLLFPPKKEQTSK